MYLLSFADTYEYPHLEAAITIGLAKGFLVHGIPSVIIWDGDHGLHEGIQHVSLKRPPDLSVTDTIIVTSPWFIPVLSEYTWMQHAKKWLFTSCDHGDRSFAKFSLILAENERDVIQVKYPSALVFDFLMGCPETIPVITKTPYSNPKTVFFCGRLGEYPPGKYDRFYDLHQLASLLPDFDIVFLSHTISLPPDRVPPSLRGYSIMPYIGSSPPWQRGNELIWAKWKDALHVQMPINEAVELVNSAIYQPNLRYLGVRNWGTFWDMYQYAYCFIDFGFSVNFGGPNTKIIDPLRAGVNIVAYGKSPSYSLISKDLGTIVPFRDVGAMASVIRDMPCLSLEAKVQRGEQFAEKNSWNAKIGRLIAQLGRHCFL